MAAGGSLVRPCRLPEDFEPIREVINAAATV
jgi:hypothetical protein